MQHDYYAVRDRIIATCLWLFVIGIGVSMYLYPGGTWWNPARERHAFCANFLCDLLHDPALNHKPNASGALIAKSSMIAFIVGLGVLWTMPERWVTDTRVIRVVRSLGVLGAFSLTLVPLTPSNHYPRLHSLAVLLGGLPALAAFLVFVAALWTQHRLPAGLRILSLLLAALILVCLGLYAFALAYPGRSTATLPPLERIAVALLLAWVALLLRQPQRPRRQGAQV